MKGRENRIRKVALTACSDPEPLSYQGKIERLVKLLKQEGLEVEVSPYLFGCFEEHPEQKKAQNLMRYFQEEEIEFIFDVSGGDIANSVLQELDYETICQSRAVFCGYSDLTTILNAIIARTGRETMNYQIRNLLYDHADEAMIYFRERILKSLVDGSDLDCQFFRGSGMHGRVLGGNIRCLLKLAGTPFWPDMRGAILLLEAYGGGVMQMTTYLHQLKQMGVLEQISGILLGTFSTMEKEQWKLTMEELVRRIVPETLPIATTRYIGHGTDAKAIILGRELSL